MGPWIVLLALAAWGEDPAQFVAQLGSPRYAQREAAGAALRALGREALPALRSALESPDAEVRTRAVALVDEIETRLMVEPTKVKLDYHDRPLGEVLKGLGEQAGVTLNVLPENSPALARRRVTLEASEPVPFWEAVERLGREAHLQVGLGAAMPAAGLGAGPASRRPTLYLLPGNGPPAPSAVVGPFRVVVVNILHHKDRVFAMGGQPQAVFVQGNVPVGLERRPAAGTGRVPGVATELFSVGLQVNAEPRMVLAQDGPLKISEAIDEQGRSLAPRDDPAQAQITRFQSLQGYNAFPAGSVLQVQVPLVLPDPPGTLVKRLRGTMPVVVLSRRENPFLVKLAEAKGKTIQNERLTLTIHEIKAEQTFTTIELTAKVRRDEAEGPQQGPIGPEFAVFNGGGQAQKQVEIVDDQGRPYQQWFAYNAQPSNEGLRLTLRLTSTEGVGPPAEIRYYDLARAETTVNFELDDIPMP
jgi:hypothetical protein